MRAPTAVPAQRRVWHFLEMLLAMSVGMLVLPPIEGLFWSVPMERADLHTLVMTCNMTVGMVVWMVFRRLPWIAMVGAMWAPFVLLAPLYYAGALDGTMFMAGGHVLMLPCMFLASRGVRLPVTRTRAAA